MLHSGIQFPGIQGIWSFVMPRLFRRAIIKASNVCRYLMPEIVGIQHRRIQAIKPTEGGHFICR